MAISVQKMFKSAPIKFKKKYCFGLICKQIKAMVRAG